jgi:hypothetical protein
MSKKTVNTVLEERQPCTREIMQEIYAIEATFCPQVAEQKRRFGTIEPNFELTHEWVLPICQGNKLIKLNRALIKYMGGVDAGYSIPFLSCQRAKDDRLICEYNPKIYDELKVAEWWRTRHHG